MKPAFDSLPALFLAAIFGCSTSDSGPSAPGARPGDFKVDYEWREGSLPPPYHYEYALSITPEGKGEIVLTPDYPRAGVPKWTEEFQVKAERLDDLYKVLAEHGLFTQTWRKLDAPPVGGSSQTLIVTAGGKQFTVEDYLVADQKAAAQAIYDAVTGLAPQEARDRLDAKREQYMQEHPRE
jgi:hypothetical protein